MRAVVPDRYGPPDVLKVAEVDRPVAGDDDVLIRIRATTVNRTDCAFRGAESFAPRFVTGLFRPKRKVLGTELSGEVEAVGAHVSEFRVGDHVFGVNAWKFGAHAEFIVMKDSAPLALKPVGTTFQAAAAACDGAILALGCPRRADLRAGRRIAVYGASGSIGTAAVIDTVKGADLGGGGGCLMVDLNFAYNPSCAYDPAWACPLAPPGNTVPVPVHAGELMSACPAPE